MLWPHRPPRAQDLQSAESTQFWELRNRRAHAARTPDEPKGKCSCWVVELCSNFNTSLVPLTRATEFFLLAYQSRVKSLAASARPNLEAAFSRPSPAGCGCRIKPAQSPGSTKALPCPRILGEIAGKQLSSNHRNYICF